LYLASFAIDECNIMCNEEKSRVGWTMVVDSCFPMMFQESQKATRGQCDTIPSIVQKVQEEVHGFYFQDDQGPGKFEPPPCFWNQMHLKVLLCLSIFLA
jgi:hypothetical protein